MLDKSKKFKILVFASNKIVTFIYENWFPENFPITTTIMAQNFNRILQTELVVFVWATSNFFTVPLRHPKSDTMQYAPWITIGHAKTTLFTNCSYSLFATWIKVKG